MRIYHLVKKDLEDIRNKIEKLMKKHKIPGLSVAVIQNFRIKNLIPLGVKKQGKKKKVNEETLFQAASISKFLTSLIIMKLVELKKLKLNENANKYLQNFKIKNKQGIIKKVTIKQLLNHTGGISCSGFKGYSHKEEVPNINEILYSKPPSNNEKILVKYKLNTYHYSGGGYIILQKIIENVTRDRFENVAEKLIFNPLKMNRSSFKQFNKKISLNFASGHEGKSKVKGDFYMYPEKAVAGLWTTAKDLANLLIEIQLCYKGKSEKILSKTTIKKILKPVIKAERNFMGFGFFISKDKKLFYHAGSNVGYKSKFIMDFKGNGIIILTNSSRGYKFISALVS